MAQYGFYFDQTVCAGCHTCQIACKDKNRLKIGTLYRKVLTGEVGEYPNPGIFHLATACNHCDNPACGCGDRAALLPGRRNGPELPDQAEQGRTGKGL